MSKKQFFVFEPTIGSTISQAIPRMIELAAEHDMDVKAQFNGIELVASRYNTPESVMKCWQAELDRRREAYDNSPAKVEADQRAEEFSQKAAAAKAEGILPFSVKDQEGWDKAVALNSKDDYSACCVRYAARWANMMEAKMTEGAKLEDIAKETSHAADLEGISGFMYGCAVSTLAQFWEHGDQLRRWHNIDTQIGTEGEKANETGGVLNPALLTVSAA